MHKRNEEMIIQGKLYINPVYTINKKEILITGKTIKIARIKEEWDVDVDEPDLLIEELKKAGLKVDIFTFMQRLPESKPKYKYYMEWDNVAALKIVSYEHWFKNQLYKNARNRIRIAEKKGVVVKRCEFTDELVRGIAAIYNETPVRQGRPFWNYGMDFDLTKKEHTFFLDRSDFLGAYYQDELIGFIKLVYSQRLARTMGILAKIEHRDKAPMNILMAKAVEVCAEKKAPYLIYAKFNYGKLGNDSLIDFKRHNGFEGLILPRFYIPLTLWGSVAMKMNLHHGIVGILPRKSLRTLRQLRNAWYARENHKLTAHWRKSLTDVTFTTVA